MDEKRTKLNPGSYFILFIVITLGVSAGTVLTHAIELKIAQMVLAEAAQEQKQSKNKIFRRHKLNRRPEYLQTNKRGHGAGRGASYTDYVRNGAPRMPLTIRIRHEPRWRKAAGDTSTI